MQSPIAGRSSCGWSSKSRWGAEARRELVRERLLSPEHLREAQEPVQARGVAVEEDPEPGQLEHRGAHAIVGGAEEPLLDLDARAQVLTREPGGSKGDDDAIAAADNAGAAMLFTGIRHFKH